MPTRDIPPTLFATTRWTLVHDAAREGDTGAVEALGSLFGTYWQPLYRYARRKGKSKEDAEDLVLDKVLGDLEAACRSEGSGPQFEVLGSCLAADSARVPYSALAVRLEMSEGAARVAVHRLRKRYRHLLTSEISRTLASPEAVEEEMRTLFAALSE